MESMPHDTQESTDSFLQLIVHASATCGHRVAAAKEVSTKKISNFFGTICLRVIRGFPLTRGLPFAVRRALRLRAARGRST